MSCLFVRTHCQCWIRFPRTSPSPLQRLCLGAGTHPTQLGQGVHALVTEVLRAGVRTTGLHLAQRKRLERDAFVPMFVTPFVYQWPSRCPAGCASASSGVFTHCCEPFCTYSNIHWLHFFNVWLNVSEKEGLLTGHNLAGDYLVKYVFLAGFLAQGSFVSESLLIFFC